MKPGYKLPETELARVLVGFKRIFATVGVFSAIINMLLLVPALYMLAGLRSGIGQSQRDHLIDADTDDRRRISIDGLA